MADKVKLTCIAIDVAKNGYEIRASYEPKKSLSQKKGWVPCSYMEPDKFVVTTKAQLKSKIDELLGEDKK